MGDHHRSMITQEAAPLVLKECADIDRLIAPFLIKAFHRFKEHLDSLAGSVAYRYVSRSICRVLGDRAHKYVSIPVFQRFLLVDFYRSIHTLHDILGGYLMRLAQLMT